MTDDELYPCLGICITDEESGYCQACGRPLVVMAPLSAEPLVETAVQVSEAGADSENR